VSRALFVRNRQRASRVDARHLRSAARTLLQELLDLVEFNLGIYLVAAPEMSRLNQSFLGHAGSTDVITFDYREPSASARPAAIHGEIFICIDEAIRQAKIFHTSWETELERTVTGCFIFAVTTMAGRQNENG
jgi:rRNA maturation RNase YbeY